jgi:hypothetical protein
MGTECQSRGRRQLHMRRGAVRVWELRRRSASIVRARSIIMKGDMASSSLRDSIPTAGASRPDLSELWPFAVRLGQPLDGSGQRPRARGVSPCAAPDRVCQARLTVRWTRSSVPRGTLDAGGLRCPRQRRRLREQGPQLMHAGELAVLKRLDHTATVGQRNAGWPSARASCALPHAAHTWQRGCCNRRHEARDAVGRSDCSRTRAATIWSAGTSHVDTGALPPGAAAGSQSEPPSVRG